MGVNLAAVLGHQLDADAVLRLPEKLTTSTALVQATDALAERLAPRWPRLGPRTVSFDTVVPSADHVERIWNDAEILCLELGAGASLSIGRHAIELHVLERFAVFVDDIEGLQQPILQFVRTVARELGAPKIIYMPDTAYPMTIVLDLVYSGGTLDEIEDKLRREFGSPAETLRAIYVETDDSVEVDGYFIDQLDTGDP